MRRILSLALPFLMIAFTASCNKGENSEPVVLAPILSNSEAQVAYGFKGQTLTGSGGLYEASGGTTVFGDSNVVITLLDSVGTPYDTITGFMTHEERSGSLSDPSLEPKVGGSFNVFAVGEGLGDTAATPLLTNIPANLEDSLHVAILDTAAMDLILKADTTTYDQCSFNGWTGGSGVPTFSNDPTWRVEFPLEYEWVNSIRANFFC